MFIPIGGIFVFGGNRTRIGAITNLVIGLVNLVFGILGITFGFINHILWLKVFGFILGIPGLLMVLFAMVALIRNRKNLHSDKDYYTMEYEI